MKTKTLIILFVLFTCSSCQKKEIKEESTAQTSDPNSSINNSSAPEPKGLLTKIFPLNEPNRYRIEIDLPPNLKPTGAEWVVERFAEKEQGRVTLPLARGEHRVVDDQISSGESYLYRFIPLGGAVAGEIAGPTTGGNEVRITVPTDLEIRGRTEVHSIRGIHRLFLRRGSCLLTQGRDLTIMVDEIIAEDGLIETFTPEDRAPEGAKGRPGGTIAVWAKKGSGILRLIGRGESGGPGLRGGQGKTGEKGASGSPGRTELIFRSSNPIYRDNLPRMVEQLEEKLALTDPFWKEVYHCAEGPGRGHPGLPGGQGGMGGNGGVGGNSSRIYVEIANASGIQVAPLSLPGEGGVGGEGGKGGAGGEGGEAGAMDRHGICNPAGNGPKGSVGEAGPTGVAGELGKIFPQCLRLGSARFGNCDPLTWQPFLPVRSTLADGLFSPP